MKRTLSEKQVLKKLGIEDFRHLSKDTVMSFASMLPQMDIEVAKKALEQFPDFASTVLETMKEYKGSVDKVLEEGTESAKHTYAAYHAVLGALQKPLDDGNLSFEEQQAILNQMVEVAKLVDEKDEKHKKFLLQSLTILGTVAVAGVAVLASALGGSTKVGSNSSWLDGVDPGESIK